MNNRWWEKMRRFEQGKYAFWLVAILALLVIGESVWIVGQIDEGAKVREVSKKTRRALTHLVRPRAAAPVARLQLLAHGQASLQTSGEVELALEVKKRVQVQGLDAYLEFNPAEVTILDADASQSGLQVEAGDNAIGQLARDLVEVREGRILLSWLRLSPRGAELLPGDKIHLATIHFVPLKRVVHFHIRLASGGQAGSKLAAALPDNATLPLAKGDVRIRVRGRTR